MFFRLYVVQEKQHRVKHVVSPLQDTQYTVGNKNMSGYTKRKPAAAIMDCFSLPVALHI